MMLAQLVAALVAAQAPDTASLNWLLGRWQGTGASFGSPGSAQLEIAPALGGKFIEIRYQVATSGSRPFHFEGRAFYLPNERGWQAQWFDSRGTSFTIVAQARDRALISQWTGATEEGQTDYKLREDGLLEVIDKTRDADGALREFARYIYSRQEP